MSKPSTTAEWSFFELLPFVDSLEQHELLMLREHIDAKLPVKDLQGLNLESELVIQYQIAKALQTATLNSHEEANKKAQTVNSCAAVLQHLVKMQAELQTAERFKQIESHLINCLERLPEEHTRQFFQWYEKQQ